MRGTRAFRLALIACLSAAAATAHEVVWGRLLAHAVGNTAWGIGLALTLFMAGMGAGSLLARRMLRRGLVRLRRAYACTELIIAASALALDGFLLWGGLLSSWVGGEPAKLHLLIDIVSVITLAAVPTLAIGLTYPLLVASATSEEGTPRAVTHLYLAGLVGGLLGVLLASLLLVPRLGYDGCAVVAAVLNLAAGGLAISTLPAASTRRSSPASPGDGVLQPTLLFSAAGAFGLGAQVVWNRVVVPYSGVSSFSFSAIVAAYLLAQAAGMGLAGKLDDRRLRVLSLWALALSPGLAMLTLGPVATIGALVPTREASAWLWALGSLLPPLLAVAPSALLLGVAQLGALRRLEAGSERAGEDVALVAGWGTVISAMAALLASMLLFPRLGPRGTLLLLAVPLWAVLLRSRVGSPALVGTAAAVLVFLTAPGPRYFLGREYDASPLVHAEHGVQDTTAVILKDLPVERRIRRLVANGMSYSGDALSAQRYMRLLGHLPALAAAGERRALVICIGTGTTAAALLPYGYERIDAVDISPSIRSTLAHFRNVNGALERDRRIRIIIEDGDRFIRLARDDYDVITLEPPPPRAPGASALYSREFYEAARRRLRPGGVLAQWLPLHGLGGGEADAIIKTLLVVFPKTTLHLVERNEAVLLGTESADLNLARPSRLRRPAVQQDLSTIGLDRVDPLAETLVVTNDGLSRLTAHAAVVRFAWPAPELAPLAGSISRQALDAWGTRLLELTSMTRATSGTAFLAALPGFVRVREGRGRAADRGDVERALARLLRRDPANPYTQYLFGYGAALDRRLDRQARAREVAEDEATAVRSLLTRHRDAARPLLGD